MQSYLSYLKKIFARAKPMNLNKYFHYGYKEAALYRLVFPSFPLYYH